MEKLLKAHFVISNKMFFVWNNLELRDVTEFTPQMGFKGQMEINSLNTQCFDLFKFFFLSDKKIEILESFFEFQTGKLLKYSFRVKRAFPGNPNST